MRKNAPDTAAKDASPRKKVVVLFGGVGTAPPAVAVIAGRSVLAAIEGTPVPVVFFRTPVERLDSATPLIDDAEVGMYGFGSMRKRVEDTATPSGCAFEGAVAVISPDVEALR